jgi:uncharacterized membrane protein YesL
MIPLSTFNTLIVIFILLVIYALVDYRNKLYGNIAAAIIASIVGTLLTILVYIGAVQTDAGVTVQDLPTAGVLLLISLVIGVYSFFMVWDAKDEYEKEQERL